MRKLRTLIVDDEPLARAGVALLAAQTGEFEIVGEAEDVPSATEAIVRFAPDLVFLDIQMPGGSGFDVLTHIPAEKLPLIVFVTAYDIYAVKAFSLQAIDYLLKPVTEERFAAMTSKVVELADMKSLAPYRKTIERLVAKVGSDGLERLATTYPDRLLIKEVGRMFFVPVESIRWIEAEDYYVRLHCHDQSPLLRESLQSLSERLDPSRFVRIHRSTLVAVSAVSAVTFESDNPHLTLRDGTQLPIGKTYKERLRTLVHR